MKFFWISYILTCIFASALIGIGAWIYRPSFLQEPKLHSPLPDFLTLISNKQVTDLSLFLPALGQVLASGTELTITTKSALVYDLTTKSVLYERNPRLKVPMASLTKVMTAIVALENPKNDNKYVITQDMLVGEDSMGLKSQEKLTLQELLYGLLLPSGNDAAEALAGNYLLGRDAFIAAMNNKAKSLGLFDTHFTNPSGLEGDGNQYTTAYDLLVITNYALSRFPLFAIIVSTPVYQIPETTTHQAYYLENETNLLTSYPGVKGVKTGFTPEAGLCLITYLEYADHKIIGILLGSENRRQEMKELLDYSLKKVHLTPPQHP